MTKIEYAVKYIDAGFQVFPVKSNTASPAIPDWKNKATLEYHQIESWWLSDPDYNIGIFLPNNSIILKVDSDPFEDVDGLKTLEKYDQLPETQYIATPFSERHYYFLLESPTDLTHPLQIDDGLWIMPSNIDCILGGGSSINGLEFHLGSDNLALALCPKWISDQTPVATLSSIDSLSTPEHQTSTHLTFNHPLSSLTPTSTFNLIDSNQVQATKEPEPPKFLPQIISEQEEIELNLDDENDTTIGENILALHNNSILFLSDTKEWCTWDGEKWIKSEDGTRQLGTWLNETIEDMSKEAKKLLSSTPAKALSLIDWLSKSKNQTKREAISRYIKERTAISNTKLDSNPNILGTGNGVLELDNTTFRKVEKEDLITRYLSTEYQHGATCPTWIHFIETVMEGDRQMIEYLQRLTGYWLTTEVSEQEIYFVYGEGGNGKSTFLDTIKILLGDYAVKIPSNAIMSSQFGQSNANDASIARTAGARLTLTDEINGDGVSLNVGLVKSLSGDDEISARFLHGNPFTFKATAKLVMYGNDKPYGDFTDAGLWRRMKLIHFSHTVPEDLRDKHLLSKLKGEMSGILNWALTGLEKWKTDGLQTPDRVLDDSKEYRSSLDNVSSFISDMVETDNHGFTATKALRTGYEHWCDSNCESPSRLPIFQRAIKKRLSKLDGVESGSTGKIRGYHGIKVKSYHSDF